MSGGVELAPQPAPAARARYHSVRRSGLALLDQSVVSGAGFASGLLVGRATSPAELGRYAVALTVVLLLTEVQNSLIVTPYTVARPRLSGRRLAEATGDATLLQLILAALAGTLLAGVSPFFPAADARLVAVVAVALVPILLRDHLRRISFAGFDLGRALRVDLLVTGLQLVALAALALADLLTVMAAFGTMAAASACGAVVWWMHARDDLRFSGVSAVAAMPEMWREGRWVLASGVAWSLGLYAYPWLLAGLRGSGAAGIWAAGVGLASLANPVLLGLGNYLGPEAAHSFVVGGASRLASFVVRSCGLLCALLLPLLVAAMLLGERLVGVVYGPAYASSGLLVFLLSLHLLMTAVAFPISRALFALGRAEVELRANLVGLVVLATLGVWLVREHGPQGAALGLALGGAASNLARAGWLREALRRVMR